MTVVDYEDLGVVADYCSHLIPVARKNAALPNGDRIAKLVSDRWIGYGRAQEAISKLNSLFSFPKKQRMPNLLLVGPTNNGKTMIIEKFIRMNSQHNDYSTRGDVEHIPIVSMQMPPDPSVSRFYAMLLQSVGAPFYKGSGVRFLENLVLDILPKIGLKILVIDEVHNLLAGSPRQQREFLNLLRMLGNFLRVPIVCVGTQEAYLAIRSDAQLENRFEPFLLPRWNLGEELKTLLASFAAVLPLRKASMLYKPTLAKILLEKTEGTIGEISQFLTEAAIIAIESGKELIDEEILNCCAYNSPTERRKIFERHMI